MKTGQKQDRGVAGLTILLSLVVMLFIIGLMVMIFTLMGGALENSSYDTTAGSFPNETLTAVDEGYHNLSVAGYKDVTCSFYAIYNASDGVYISSEGNYSTYGCSVNGWAGNFSQYEAVANETLTTVDTTGHNVSVSSYANVACAFGMIINNTDGVVIDKVGNYTTVNCEVRGLAGNYSQFQQVNNESLTTVDNQTGELLSESVMPNVDCTVQECINATSGNVIPSADWQEDGCRVSALINTTANNYTNTDWNCSYNYTYDKQNLFNNTNWNVSYNYTYDRISIFNGTNWNVTYSYVYEADTLATGVMNKTTSGIAGVVDWMDIFIVIGAMVVLILLTVIIISAIRSSGMVDSGGNSGQRDVGTA